MRIFQAYFAAVKPKSNFQTKSDMKKSSLTIITLLAAILIPALCSGKITRRKISIFRPTVPESTVISQKPGTLEFVYDYSFSVNPSAETDGERESDRMLLQIAPDGLSKFTSLTNITVDSIIMNTSLEQRVEAITNGQLKKGESMNVFKNYPEQGKMTNTEIVCEDWFRYEEEMPEFDWELTDSVRNILGYECKGARCSFRGRDWEVFYAEDIPVTEGPWKLCGLPGLIMQAKADGNEYSFVCIGIKNNSQRPISLYDVPYNKTSRLGFYDAKHRYDINPYSYFEASGGGKVTVTDENGNPMPGAYDPVELPFDYIEKDWRERK